MKVYAGLCTLLFTAYLGLVLWWIISPKSPHEDLVMNFKSSYDRYMAKEFPKREKYFEGLAQYLGEYATAVPVPTADVLKYLGKPDLIDGTVEKGTFVYFYGRSGFTNRWVAYVTVIEGKLLQIGYGDLTEDGLPGFQPYRPQ
ncbi:MAG: hypothetical protein EPO07_12065 [Verrucomicrobia bacterium]|nr:MAG: hypothetical protein EPO07_12065 [Verrucomicrobiota bacterium]